MSSCRCHPSHRDLLQSCGAQRAIYRKVWSSMRQSIGSLGHAKSRQRYHEGMEHGSEATCWRMKLTQDRPHTSSLPLNRTGKLGKAERSLSVMFRSTSVADLKSRANQDQDKRDGPPSKRQILRLPSTVDETCQFPRASCSPTTNTELRKTAMVS